MKLIIAGGRDRWLDAGDFDWLDELADRLGVTQTPARWRQFGGAAGPMRNRQMAEAGDALALFSGGSGSASMRRCARDEGISIFEEYQLP